MGYKGRDAEVIPLNENQYITIACDSCGAIGSKELDIVKVPPYIVGRFTARVVLMETISIGAVPKIITAAISNEPYPTGEGILEGIKDELKFMDISSLPINISTEKNVPTRQTAVGITVVGICDREDLRIASSMSGDIVYCLGIPKVGDEVKYADNRTIAQGKHIQQLIKVNGVHDIVPVGSKGILKEAQMLACNTSCKFVLEPFLGVDVEKSAGPCTCIIFSCSPDAVLPDFESVPIFKIGKLI